MGLFDKFKKNETKKNDFNMWNSPQNREWLKSVTNELFKNEKITSTYSKNDRFGLHNVSTGMGGVGDITANDVITSPTFQTWEYFDALYRTNIFAQKLIDLPAGDMTKKWRKFTGEDSDIIDKRQKFEKKFRVAKCIEKAVRYADLYGGSALLIVTTETDRLDIPLDFKNLKRDQFKKLQPVFLGQMYPDAGLHLNPQSQFFGKSEYYNVNNNDSIRVHCSRLILFTGRDLPLYASISQLTFGDSRLTAVRNILNACESIYLNIANLIARANIDTLAIKDFDMAAAKNPASIYQKTDVIAEVAGNINKLIIDSNDVFTRSELQNIQGLAEILLTFIQMVAAAGNMPLTRFLGTSVGGFSSGDNEILEYQDSIKERQNGITDQLETIDMLIEYLIFGERLDINYEFLSINTESNAQKAADQSAKAQRDATYLNNRVVTPAIVAQQLKSDNVYEGITEKYIKELENEDFEESDDDFEEWAQSQQQKNPNRSETSKEEPGKQNT